MSKCSNCEQEPTTPGSDLGLSCGIWEQIRYGLIPADLALDFALRADDHAEDHGMHPDDRLTCFTCQSWATPEHSHA